MMFSAAASFFVTYLSLYSFTALALPQQAPELTPQQQTQVESQINATPVDLSKTSQSNPLSYPSYTPSIDISSAPSELSVAANNVIVVLDKTLQGAINGIVGSVFRILLPVGDPFGIENTVKASLVKLEGSIVHDLTAQVETDVKAKWDQIQAENRVPTKDDILALTTQITADAKDVIIRDALAWGRDELGRFVNLASKALGPALDAIKAKTDQITKELLEVPEGADSEKVAREFMYTLMGLERRGLFGKKTDHGTITPSLTAALIWRMRFDIQKKNEDMQKALKPLLSIKKHN